MANSKESENRAADIIKNWLRTRFAIEFLSVWEQINNPNFKVVESDHFKSIELRNINNRLLNNYQIIISLTFRNQ